MGHLLGKLIKNVGHDYKKMSENAIKWIKN